MHTVRIGFDFIWCIYMQVNHVEPGLGRVFVRMRVSGSGVLKGNLSCQRLLNGKPVFELCNGLYVNKLHIISFSLFMCILSCEDRSFYQRLPVTVTSVIDEVLKMISGKQSQTELKINQIIEIESQALFSVFVSSLKRWCRVTEASL